MNDLFGSEVLPRRAIGSHHAASASSGSDEWCIPKSLIDALGAFDLDPCSPGERRPWDTAATHYNAEQDGMRLPWEGRVWLNPPYSDARRWLARLADHGRGTAIVFARTETALWFDTIWPRASGLLFLRGRVTFCHVDGRPAKANSGAPSALVAYGSDDAALLRSCGLAGHFVALEAALRGDGS